MDQGPPAMPNSNATLCYKQHSKCVQPPESKGPADSLWTAAHVGRQQHTGGFGGPPPVGQAGSDLMLISLQRV